MKKVIYTVIFGDYDNLKEPTIISDGWDYICFTNQPLKSDVWKIVQVKTDKPNHIIAREISIYPYDYLEGYDIAMSVGGQVGVKSDLNNYLLDLECLNLLSHPDRQCIYQELMQIALREKDSWQNVIKSAEYFHKEKMPQNNGLYATGIMGRDLHNSKVKGFCKIWLLELNRFCFRDQVSLAYCIWKWQFKHINTIDFNVLFNEFQLTKHK